MSILGATGASSARGPSEGPSAGRAGVDARAVDAAARALAAGQVVALPTDTVYGLAVDPFRRGATDRLFALKGRPREVHLPVLVASEEQALELTTVSEVARRLMARFWPGALTLVLPRRSGVVADLGGDQTTVGVRCPAHPVPTAVCRLTGPLATTSANRHREPPLATATDVVAAFGEGVSLVLDGGTCSGLPSTVVDCTGHKPELLRPGRVPWEQVVAAAGP
ncbi:MAG: L-threonylcarbamoyladenylate synthase [Actinomycetota bacterium]|nr:L-threonylcarbamoyladenylate synthase [Actinomycetota bacterium]